MIFTMNRLSMIAVLGLILAFPSLGYATIPKQPELLPLSVFIGASSNDRSAEIQKLRTRLSQTQGIVVVENKQEAVAEIEIRDNGVSSPPTLVARPGSKSTFLQWEPFDAPLTEPGLDIFADNLHIVQRLQGIDEKTSGQERATVRLAIYEQGIRTSENTPVAGEHLLVEGKIWKLATTIPVTNYVRLSQERDRVALVTAQNTSQAGLFIYGINITKTGKILVFSPYDTKKSNGQSDAYIAPRSSKSFDDFSLILSEDTEGVYIVQSHEPLDFSKIESDGFNTIISSAGRTVQDDAQSTW